MEIRQDIAEGKAVDAHGFVLDMFVNKSVINELALAIDDRQFSKKGIPFRIHNDKV